MILVRRVRLGSLAKFNSQVQYNYNLSKASEQKLLNTLNKAQSQGEALMIIVRRVVRQNKALFGMTSKINNFTEKAANIFRPNCYGSRKNIPVNAVGSPCCYSYSRSPDVFTKT